MLKKVCESLIFLKVGYDYIFCEVFVASGGAIFTNICQAEVDIEIS